MYRARAVFLCSCLFAALTVGCFPTGTAKSPADYFRENQTATMTPHGKIKTETVEEKNGKITYQTTDGKKWQVGYSKRADGTYEYTGLEEVK